MNNNPLINLPDNNTAPIHIMVTKPGAIAGDEAQRQEIALALPKCETGKHWEYQPMAVQPLRFATSQDADGFLEALKEGKATDRFFVNPMRYDALRKKWCVNKSWGQAAGELVVFVQKDDAVPAPTEETPAHVN